MQSLSIGALRLHDVFDACVWDGLLVHVDAANSRLELHMFHREGWLLGNELYGRLWDYVCNASRAALSKTSGYTFKRSRDADLLWVESEISWLLWMKSDHYAILAFLESATAEEIRKVFSNQKLVRFHPDINKEPDAEERFLKEVSGGICCSVRCWETPMLWRNEKFMAAAMVLLVIPVDPPMEASFEGGFLLWWYQLLLQLDYWISKALRAYKPQTGADITYDLTLNDCQTLKWR